VVIQSFSRGAHLCTRYYNPVERNRQRLGRQKKRAEGRTQLGGKGAFRVGTLKNKSPSARSRIREFEKVVLRGKGVPLDPCGPKKWEKNLERMIPGMKKGQASILGKELGWALWGKIAPTHLEKSVLVKNQITPWGGSKKHWEGGVGVRPFILLATTEIWGDIQDKGGGTVLQILETTGK